MSKKIEILAPAGSYESMKAAMNAGCDAVYIGGSSFGARAYANNLEEGTLLQAIDEAHIRNKNLYLTVNTLLKEQELKSKLYNFIDKLYLQGLDAVIVQDVGVMNFIHEHFPDLPIHASTQMTLTMAEGANLLKDYGVTRIVTSRELSLKEIKKIRENTTLEIETFVHGALCYCYSGQCLMSSLIGGRSGNRGRCAQPCRMPYQFFADDKKNSKEEEKYLLSPKDINTITLIPELVDAGIDSFKIEGRMKRPEYAAMVSFLYRKYVDLYLEQGRQSYEKFLTSAECQRDMTNLQDIYNRGGFSTGYGETYHGKKMMSLSRPNHSGVHVGVVKEVGKGQVSISVKDDIHAQDILEIRHLEEGLYEFTVKDPHKPDEILRTNVGNRPQVEIKDKRSGKSVNSNDRQVIKTGDLVYRTRNNELLEELDRDYLAKDAKLGIKGKLVARVGERISFTAHSQGCSATAYHDIVQPALKQPMTLEKLRAPLEKTGDTLYYFEEIEMEVDENIFVPVAWLNDLRRESINMLYKEVVAKYQRSTPINLNFNGYETPTALKSEDEEYKHNSLKEQNTISASLQTADQFESILGFEEVTNIHVDYDTLTREEILRMSTQAEINHKKFYLSLPHICRLGVFESLKKDLYEIIDNNKVTGFIIKNFEEISLLTSLLKEKGLQKELILNHNLYIFNKEAKAFWRKQELYYYTAPVELNYQELKNLGVEDCDLIVYGYLPMMTSTQCLFDNTEGCRKGKKREDRTQAKIGFHGILTDRMGKEFFVKANCEGCYNVIYNGQPLSLHQQVKELHKLKPRGIRLDFTKESGEQTKKVMQVFIEEYYYNRKSLIELNDYTTGHFKRGVE
ncbi:MAG: DUF3656 domain-containing protein [Mobilitalea sp.]